MADTNPYEAPRSRGVSTRGGGGTVITDVDIPFLRMVVIIIKWTLASIPAAIIVWLLLMAIMIVLGLVFGGAVTSFVPR